MISWALLHNIVSSDRTFVWFVQKVYIWLVWKCLKSIKKSKQKKRTYFLVFMAMWKSSYQLTPTPRNRIAVLNEFKKCIFVSGLEAVKL